MLRFGAYNPEVFTRLEWMQRVMGPAMQAAVRQSGGIDARAIIAEAVQMGDDGHNRNKSGTALFYRTLAFNMVDSGLPANMVSETL